LSEAARTCKAVVYREGAAAVAVERIHVRGPRQGEATVRVAACGVCHSDLSATNGTIPIPPPVVLGHEGAGVVVEVGDGVSDLAPGDHVVSVFVSMCGRCRWCVTGRPALCDQASRAVSTLPDGSVPTTDSSGAPLNVFSGCGVMAEYATLHTDNLVRIDAGVPLDRAALLGCGVMTGVGAVFNTARVEPGASVVVFGAGGVGLSAIQACALAGAATIIAVDPVDAKLEMAQRLGATHTLNAAREANVVKSVRKLTGGGADYAFECVGKGDVVAMAYGAVGKGGTAVVVGVAGPRDVTPVPTASLTFSEKTLKGSYFGSARPKQDFPRLLALYASGRLRLDDLITRRYTIEQAPEAFADLVAGVNARGMIVLA
jgi:S-(hydroxymethyl)glutathione dehydrogenase/alcohol dehydrogenase